MSSKYKSNRGSSYSSAGASQDYHWDNYDVKNNNKNYSYSDHSGGGGLPSANKSRYDPEGQEAVSYGESKSSSSSKTAANGTGKVTSKIYLNISDPNAMPQGGHTANGMQYASSTGAYSSGGGVVVAVVVVEGMGMTMLININNNNINNNNRILDTNMEARVKVHHHTRPITPHHHRHPPLLGF